MPINKRIKLSPKNLWLAVNFALLALPVLLPSSGVDSTINICLMLLILLSFPLCIPTGWLFFVSGLIGFSTGSLYLMLIVCSALSYLQWFVFVPRFAGLVRQMLGGKDLQIRISANVKSVKQLPEPSAEFTLQNWQKEYYDERQRTPVERLFDKNFE